MKMIRYDSCVLKELWKIIIEINVFKYLEGLVVILFGDIKVICLVIVEEKVFLFLWGGGIGWVVVEYSMFFCVMNIRNIWESVKGKLIGWIMEI